MNYNIICGDAQSALSKMESGSAQCCVTSPPYYGLRDYGSEGQIGLEHTPEQYIQNLIKVFREVRRVLSDDGTLWVNIGDSYAGSGKGSAAYKRKDLIGIPWMLAFALRLDGWYLRQDIIWAKPNPMPESVKDRCTKSHEYIFLLTKSPRYYFDAEAIREPIAESTIRRCEHGKAPRYCGKKYAAMTEIFYRTKSGNMYKPRSHRNKRDVWTVATHGYKGAHFATFPEQLITPCILAGTGTGDAVLDPFSGAGTTGIAALRNGRSYIGIEINPNYVALQEQRIKEEIDL